MPPETRKNGSKGPRILIVDDDAEIRSLLRRYLENSGLRVTAVADGRGMWQALDAGRLAGAVLDVNTRAIELTGYSREELVGLRYP